MYDVANRTKCIQSIPKAKVQLALRTFHLCLVIADAITHTVEVLDVPEKIHRKAPLRIWYTGVALCWGLLVFEAVILAWVFHKYRKQRVDPEYDNSKWAFALKMQQFAVLLVSDWLITLPYNILGSACYIDSVKLTAQVNKVSVTVSLLGSVFRACYVFICGWIYHMGRSHALQSFSGLCGYFMLVLLRSISLVVIIYKVMLVFNNFPMSHLCDMNFSITKIDKTHVTSSYEEESLEYWFVVLSLLLSC